MSPLTDPAEVRAHIARFAPSLQAVALDVDGTLTDAEHRVSAGNLAALRRLDAAGVAVIVLTGRGLRAGASALLDARLHGYVAALNGALVVDLTTDEEVARTAQDPEVTLQMLRLARERDLTCVYNTAEEILFDRAESHGRGLGFIAAANAGVPTRVADLDAVDPAQVLKLMVGGSKEQLDAFDETALALTPSWTRPLDDWGEAPHAHTSKWTALELILGRLGIDAAHVAGAGDGGNDVSWLSRVGLSAAMANARPELTEVSQVVIGHHLDDGAAQFIDALLAAR